MSSKTVGDRRLAKPSTILVIGSPEGNRELELAEQERSSVGPEFVQAELATARAAANQDARARRSLRTRVVRRVVHLAPLPHPNPVGAARLFLKNRHGSRKPIVYEKAAGGVGKFYSVNPRSG